MISRFNSYFVGVGIAIVLIAAIIVGVLGIPFGIDFTGGALSEVSYDARPDKAALETTLDTLDLGGYSLRTSESDDGKEGYVLRTRDLSEEERQVIHSVLADAGEGGAIARYTSIGPVIGTELARKAGWALAGVILIIVLYVAFVFRKVPKPVSGWYYGLITIFALCHDVLVPTAAMSLLGYFTGVEADVLFVMALLAILGYSVNDTIVVFDRVRENLLKNKESGKKEPFGALVDRSVKSTLARSINTSLTTLCAVLALYFFGGAATTTFAFMLAIGVIAGTYSSIFIANPLLIATSRYQDARK